MIDPAIPIPISLGPDIDPNQTVGIYEALENVVAQSLQIRNVKDA